MYTLIHNIYIRCLCSRFSFAHLWWCFCPHKHLRMNIHLWCLISNIVFFFAFLVYVHLGPFLSFSTLMLFNCVCLSFVLHINTWHLIPHMIFYFFVLFNSFIVSKIVPQVYIEQLTFITIVNIHFCGVNVVLSWSWAFKFSKFWTCSFFLVLIRTRILSCSQLD
jgi:hypothetical protein